MPDMPDTRPEVVFLLDVDNTLLDNDAVERDLRDHLEAAFGHACQQRYWAIFEQLRAELGYADYLGALQRFRIEQPREPHLLTMSLFLLDYPFADRLYPGALDAVHACATRATTVVLSDGDVVFQPRKIARAGIWNAVEGRVLIYIHKEQMLDDVAQRYPASRYVMVDDKLRILDAMKRVWGDRLTTVFVRQGHYATDAAAIQSYAPADIVIEQIAGLAGMALHPGGRSS